MDEEEIREALTDSIQDNSLGFWLNEIAAICLDYAKIAKDEGADEGAAMWNKAARAVEKCARSDAVEDTESAGDIGYF